MKPKQITPTLVPEALQEFLLKESNSKRTTYTIRSYNLEKQK